MSRPARAVGRPPAHAPRSPWYPRGASLLLTCLPLAGPACASRATAPRAPEPAPPPASARAEPEPAREDPARAVRELTFKIMGEVARARRLPATGTLDVARVSRPQIRAFVAETLYEHVTPERFRLLARADASLGIIPHDEDPERIVLDLLETGVLGFYDPKRETFFVSDFVPSAMLGMVVGHEIVHGLQDMHFDLERLQQPIDHDADAESARTFLIEGDAQAAYFAWMGGEDGLANIQDRVLDVAIDQTLELAESHRYPILARSLQLPYTAGTATLVALARADGWAAVDALYQVLPTTTEQMLHLDKLRAREAAVPVQVAAEPLAAATGLSVVWHDTLGEAALLAMLGQVHTAPAARRAAAGWGGGRYLVLDDPAHPSPTPLLAGGLAWDTVADAREFEAAFRTYLDARIGPDRSLLTRSGKLVRFAVRIPAGHAPRDLARPLARAVTVERRKS